MGNRISYETLEGCDKGFPCEGIPENGSVLSCEDISPEIMFRIFIHVPVKDLLKSAVCVCKTWHLLLTDNHFWFLKLKAEGLRLSDTTKARLLEEPDDAKVLRILQGISGRYLPFNTNLVLNPSGKDKFKHWALRHGGNKMIVECPPVGSDLIPDEAGLPSQHCFVTSYNTCFRSQVINLKSIGIDPWIIDILKPQVHISEWVSARWDCHSQSKVVVMMEGLRNTVSINIPWSSDQDDTMVSKWYKVKEVVLDYPERLRKITYTNLGKDSQYWAGHYGAKTAGSSVELVI